MSSSAATPEDYLRELPPPRAAELAVVRAAVNESIADGFVEQMGYGMISWVVPLEVYPDTYNRQPLTYAALAAQKNHSSLYLMTVYGGAVSEEEFRARWSAPRKLDMGKACVRFKVADDLDLPLIREVIGSLSLERYVELTRAARSER